MAANPFSFAGFAFPSNLLDADEFDEAANAWVSRTNLPSPSRNNGHAAGVAGVGYHMGGSGGSPTATLTDNDAYTRSTNSWTAKTSDPVGKIGGNDAAVAGSSIYNVYSDFAASAIDVVSYSPAGDSWSSLAQDTGYYVGGAAVGTDGTDVFSAGGSGSGGTPVRTVEKYDVAGDSWSSLTDTPTPARSSASALSRPAAGKVLCAFGEDITTGPVSLFRDVDEYDVSGDSWSSLGDGPTPARTRTGHAAVSSTTGYVMGGSDSGTSSEIKDFDSYAFITDTWSAESDLPSPARLRNAGAAV